MAVKTDTNCKYATMSGHYPGQLVGNQLDRRRFGTCRQCDKKIYSNRLRGHMTRDVKFGPWYTETFIVTEWP